MARPRGSLARLFCQVPAPDDPGDRYPSDDSGTGFLARLAGRYLSVVVCAADPSVHGPCGYGCRSEEHTSELQSRPHLVCRLLLEKKNREFMRRRLRTAG